LTGNIQSEHVFFLTTREWEEKTFQAAQFKGAGNNGNVFGITNYKDTTRNQTFTYDALNRLASAQNAGTDCTAPVLGGLKKFWGNTYTYDAWGNLITKALLQTPAPPACGGENLSVTADAHNWIHATGGADYRYDAAGNMTFNATPPTQTYTYDQENRLTGAAGYTYTYDADGNRVVKSNGSTGTLYWYMTPGIVGESDLGGNLTDEYVFFYGERVARKSTNGVFYYFSDHLKTASVITDSSGNIKSESDFYPWGGELQFVANDSNHYKFTGKERDAETQLDYFGARYFSNGLGRWVSADWSSTPIPVPYADFGDPQSLNLYGYVTNNPAIKIDPDGHCTKGGEQKGSLWCFFHYSDQDALVEAKNFFKVNNVQKNGHRIDPSKMTDAELLQAWNDFNKEWNAIAATGAKPWVAMATPAMLGANGTQVTSKTLWQGDGERIDVENPNPGQRPGQIHYQDGGGKYIYDVGTGQFQGLSKTKSDELLSKPEVQAAIQKGLKYLGVGQ
jgi:RHS repeat-associated protein